VRAASGRRFAESTGQRYRRVWKEAGKLSPGGDLPVWAEAYETILESTRGSLRERLAASDIRQGLQHATPEVKRDTFAQLAADPEVLREAARLGSPTAKAAADLFVGSHRIRESQREQQIESDPIQKLAYQTYAAMDIEGICRRYALDTERFLREVSEALPRTGPAGSGHLHWVREAIDRARSALDQLSTYVETGRNDVDRFLEEVLKGGTRG
jgi:hypothetical protein